MPVKENNPISENTDLSAEMERKKQLQAFSLRGFIKLSMLQEKIP